MRYTKYTFAVLHGAALFYAAECTVATIQLVYSTRKRADKTHAQKALTIARGTAAQVSTLWLWSCNVLAHFCLRMHAILKHLN